MGDGRHPIERLSGVVTQSFIDRLQAQIAERDATIDTLTRRVAELGAKLVLLTGAVDLVRRSGATAGADTWSKSEAITNLYKTADAVQAPPLPAPPEGADHG